VGKVAIGPQTLICPKPLLLVGANVNEKANFMAVAWGGIANSEPPMIAVGIRHGRHTMQGIRQNLTFSVNIPSASLLKEADYCGIVSGAGVDKARACGFEVFYGKLKNAPLVAQCPVNLECQVVHLLDLGSHALVVGRIEETHLSDSCLTDGKPDIGKIKPAIYSSEPAAHYRVLGEIVAAAHSIGNELKPRT